jgi:hypothetical protein
VCEQDQQPHHCGVRASLPGVLQRNTFTSHIHWLARSAVPDRRIQAEGVLPSLLPSDFDTSRSQLEVFDAAQPLSDPASEGPCRTSGAPNRRGEGELSGIRFNTVQVVLEVGGLTAGRARHAVKLDRQMRPYDFTYGRATRATARGVTRPPCTTHRPAGANLTDRDPANYDAPRRPPSRAHLTGGAHCLIPDELDWNLSFHAPPQTSTGLAGTVPNGSRRYQPDLPAAPSPGSCRAWLSPGRRGPYRGLTARVVHAIGEPSRPYPAPVSGRP